MPDEPDELDDVISRAEDAFSGQLGRPEYEEGSIRMNTTPT